MTRIIPLIALGLLLSGCVYGPGYGYGYYGPGYYGYGPGYGGYPGAPYGERAASPAQRAGG